MIGTQYKLIAYLILVAEVGVFAAVAGTVVREAVLDIIGNAVEAIESATALVKNM